MALLALVELALLGHDVAEGTVAKYMVKRRKPPSQTWRTFLDNHVPDIAACDFFTVPSVTFRVLNVLVVLRHDRRQVVHFNVTTNPYAEWTAQQIINAFPYETGPHLSLDRNAPTPRAVEIPSLGEVVSIPQVGGLHHRYTRRAA